MKQIFKLLRLMLLFDDNRGVTGSEKVGGTGTYIYKSQIRDNRSVIPFATTLFISPSDLKMPRKRYAGTHP